MLLAYFLSMPYCWCPDSSRTSIYRGQSWQHLWSGEGIANELPILQAREACTGIPGNILKLLEERKYVLSHEGTKIQLGSGWKPGRIGFAYMLLATSVKAPEARTTAM